eukprot:m.107277 g.107277  ORF g.107277 m.107277 type:complete len:83 (+) comp51700_c0_seq1:1167-1415(+)
MPSAQRMRMATIQPPSRLVFQQKVLFLSIRRDFMFPECLVFSEEAFEAELNDVEGELDYEGELEYIEGEEIEGDDLLQADLE